MQLRLAPLSLLGGIAAGVATVAVYQLGYGLALAVATVVVLLVVTPAGWGTRLPYGLGFVLIVGVLSVTRGEGDYVITSTTGGYVVLGLALVVLVWSVATLPRPGRRAAAPPE